jgi:hypothetical protein
MNTKQTLIEYFSVLNDFQDIVVNMKAGRIGVLVKFANFFNIRLEYPIRDGHFYHYISEAWLLSIFHALKVKYMKELEESIYNQTKCQQLVLDKNFKEILEDIQYINIDLDFFVDALEVLLGTFNILDPVIKVTQMRLSQLYLKKLNLARVEKLNIPGEVLNREEFERVLFKFMLYGLGYTLNELDPKVEDKDSKILIDAYTKIDNTDEFEINFNQYISQLNKLSGKGMENTEIELLNVEQTFFNFAKYKFSDILNSIKIFNLNFGRWQKLLLDFTIEKANKLYINMNQLAGFVRKNSEFRLVLSYLWAARNYLHDKRVVLTENTICGLKQLKEWIGKGLDNNRVILIGTDMLYKIINIENLATQAKNVITYTTGTTYNILLNISHWSKEVIFGFTNLTRNILAQIFSLNNIFDTDPMFKFSTDNEKYLHLEIRKNLTVFNKMKINEIINNLLAKFKSFDLAIAKDYLITRFKAFLGEEPKKPTPVTSNIHVEMHNIPTPK